MESIVIQTWMEDDASFSLKNDQKQTFLLSDFDLCVIGHLSSPYQTKISKRE